MNQYFVINRNDTGRETFESARREATKIGGYVVKHYSRDDINRDYEGGK